MWPLVLDTCQGQKDPERVILVFPLRFVPTCLCAALGEVLPQLVGTTHSLIHTAQTQCLFITWLLKLLDVLLAYYPLGEFINRTGKSHRGLIFLFF